MTNAPQTITATIASTVATNILIGAQIYEITGAHDASNSGAKSFSAAQFSASIITGAAGAFAMCALLPSDFSTTYTQNNGATQDWADSISTMTALSNGFASAGANVFTMTPSAAVHTGWLTMSFTNPTPDFVPRMNYGLQPFLAT